MDKTLAWTVGLNDSCEHLLSPAVTNDGKVYVAANHRVIVISYSQELDLLSVWDLYNGTGLDGSMLGSKPITGLTLMGNGTFILINAGVGGLYAVAEDGSPLWSTRRDFNSKDASFPPGTFCSDQDKLCYFHFSPAVDQCDGSIYIVHTNGWLYAIDGWNPYVKWRYDIKSQGNTSVAGVTAGYNGRVHVATVTGVLFTFDTTTGHLLWQVTVGPLTNRTCFPKLDGKGISIANQDGMLDATLLLSVFATNYSLGGICDAFGAYAEGWKCSLSSSDALEGVPAYIGRSIEPLYLAFPLTFFVLATMLLIWFLLRKRYEHNYRRSVPPEVYDQHILPGFQDLCHKRAIFENKVLRLELLLKNNPESKELQRELHKAVEDLYSNEWVLSHFSHDFKNDTDLEPLLHEAALSSPVVGMLAMSSCSSVAPRKGKGLLVNSSSLKKGAFPVKKAKKIGFSQTSFNDAMDIEGVFPNRALSRRCSANPLFKASESLGRLMLPEFRTTDNTCYGASDLENAYSPCWNSTEMSLYDQRSVDPSLDSFRGGDADAMAANTISKEVQERNTSLYSSTPYATHSVNYDEYERDMNTHHYNANYSFGEISQDDMMDDSELKDRSSLQPVTKDLKESVIEREPHLGAASHEYLEQEDNGGDADTLILDEEGKRPSVTLVSKVESNAPVGNDAMAFVGTPLLDDEKLFEQGDGQLPNFGMVGVSGFELPLNRSGLSDTKLDLSPLPHVVDDFQVEEQDVMILQEAEETLHVIQDDSFKDVEDPTYTGEQDTEDLMRDRRGTHLEEECEDSSLENLYQAEGDSSSSGEATNLCRNHGSIEEDNVVARGGQDSSTVDKTDNESKVAESTANTSDASPDTSVSSRSESSNQSTPRSLVTTSVSEPVESLNSKASTITDVSDDESISDKSEREGEVAPHYREITIPSGSQRKTRAEGDIVDCHGMPPPIELSSRLSRQTLTATATESRTSTALQGVALPRSYSTSQQQGSVRSQQFSISRLPTVEMRSLDLRRSVSEDRTLYQGSIMASGSNPRIPPGRASLSRWGYEEEENSQREPS